MTMRRALLFFADFDYLEFVWDLELGIWDFPLP
jgi:hypothetical protein